MKATPRRLHLRPLSGREESPRKSKRTILRLRPAGLRATGAMRNDTSTSSRIVLSAALLAVCGTLGCFSENGPKTYKVRGTLNVGGDQLDFGVVRFYSPMGRGIVNARVKANGVYNVELQEGIYTVAIEAIPPIVPPEGVSSDDIDPSLVPKSLIPEIYRKWQWSPLKYDVSSTKENVYDIRI